MDIVYHPIGFIQTPFEDIAGMPIQPSAASGVRGQVEVYPEYTQALQDLEGFSHIILLYHLHRSQGYQLKVVPFLDTQERGLFATRAPKRPNPIGLSVVRLLSVEPPNLTVENVDMLNGTPLLDIKPYIPHFDGEDEVRIGWVEAARQKIRGKRSDARFG